MSIAKGEISVSSLLGALPWFLTLRLKASAAALPLRRLTVDGLCGDNVDGDIVGMFPSLDERAMPRAVEDEASPGGGPVVVVELVSDLELRDDAIASFGSFATSSFKSLHFNFTLISQSFTSTPLKAPIQSQCRSV